MRFELSYSIWILISFSDAVESNHLQRLLFAFFLLACHIHKKKKLLKLYLII